MLRNLGLCKFFLKNHREGEKIILVIIKLLNKANECIETDFAGRVSLWRNLKKLMAGQTSFVTKSGHLQTFIEKSLRERANHFGDY